MKFATIAVIALVAITADAKAAAKKGSCGKIVVTSYVDKDCKKVGKVVPLDMSAKSDVCTAKKQITTCDTKGETVTTYTDAKCTKVDTTKPAVLSVWGKCTTLKVGGKVGGKVVHFTVKGAEALKMAVTGAALALVASQF